jgi:hypothetical protein
MIRIVERRSIAMKLKLKVQKQTSTLSKFAIARLARQYKSMESFVDDDVRKTEEVEDDSLNFLRYYQ